MAPKFRACSVFDKGGGNVKATREEESVPKCRQHLSRAVTHLVFLCPVTLRPVRE